MSSFVGRGAVPTRTGRVLAHSRMSGCRSVQWPLYHHSSITVALQRRHSGITVVLQRCRTVSTMVQLVNNSVKYKNNSAAVMQW